MFKPSRNHVFTDSLYLSHLNLADLTSVDDAEIDVLLGADIYAAIIQERNVRGKPNEPVTTACSLGSYPFAQLRLKFSIPSLCRE